MQYWELLFLVLAEWQVLRPTTRRMFLVAFFEMTPLPKIRWSLGYVR